MKHLILALVALAPLPALADYQCTAERQCGGGACEPYTGGPFLIAQSGETFRVTADDLVMDGHFSNAGDSEEISIVLPPQNGMSGLISIFPDGAFLFTVHAKGDMAVAISGEGSCTTTGG
ncbi:hypothetical protein [Tabrizicola sp.]|uniref:hypothetical protein n=1 Tax=Tabrizicola sp. TaxID=2005166 RepID=UPI0035B45695